MVQWVVHGRIKFEQGSASHWHKGSIEYHSAMTVLCVLLQAGERGAREVAFYEHMEQHRLTGQAQQEQQQQGNQEAMTGSQAQQEGHLPAGHQQQQEQQQQQPQVLSHAVCSTCRCPLQHSLMQQLAAWVPLSCE